jgi:hypothetical protein
MPANQIRQTRAGFDAIVSEYRAAWREFGAGEEITHFLKRSAALQRKTHQAGDDVIEADQFRGTVRAFDTKKDFCWLCIVMGANVERALAGDPDLLRDVIPAGGKSTARTLSVAYIVHATCKWL